MPVRRSRSASFRHVRSTTAILWGLLPAVALFSPPGHAQEVRDATTEHAPAQPDLPGIRSFVRSYCYDCHDDDARTGGLSLKALTPTEFTAADVARHADAWEYVVRRLRSRQMPPLDAPRPSEAEYDAAIKSLETALDRVAVEHPRPGRTETFRRLNRTEYRNAIRDLLALDVDVAELLPADESSHGFDNITVGDLTPTLLGRYISAAQRISRLALGRAEQTPGGDTIRVRPDITQESHVPGLPLGTRGGALIPYTFIQDGRYDVAIRLMRDRNELVEGLTEPHQLVVLLDRREMAEFTVKPPRGEQEHATADAHLKTRLTVKAGPHDLGVTFIEKSPSLLETKRQPYNAHFNFHRHPRISPAIYQVAITGPYEAQGPGDTPSRRRILICTPAEADDELACATRILKPLMRRAYRRPINDEDLQTPLKFYHDARLTGGFEAGIEAALSAILVSPQFLFRIERDPPDVAPQTAYKISDIELASRLSFFLWSSLPDDELLDLATAGRLSQPDVLESQVRRMLVDPRSHSLAANFAGQWLHLRNLESITPDLRLFPDFDDNLRQAFRAETELLFDWVMREDQSVLSLLEADHTYLNERLAEHYGIPHTFGSRFRRVPLDADSRRGGLLRHGSILTVTSYATRTSPVVRGNWILANLLGTKVPPPPPDVPALEDNTVSAALPLRERLEEHRKNPACATCHNLMDPPGFSLENFDAIGRWRVTDAGQPIDASGGLPDGSRFTGVSGLERGLLNRPELFVATMTEKLLTFALGRGIEPSDAPAVRGIVRQARENDYRFSSLIGGIVRSVPFQMRTSE